MTNDNDHRAIGKVISVSSDKFVVELHQKVDNFNVIGFDDIHYVARIGSFVMIPIQSDYVVAEISGLREKDPSSNKLSKENSGELDKASSAKYLDVIPLGTLPKNNNMSFKFGVSNFPSLYADALYALDGDLDRIFETKNIEEENKTSSDAEEGNKLNTLSIGSSVVFQGYDIKVRINDYFGGHTAILGNTGSGKSCTVATIIQSIFNKKDEFLARGATFIIFDVNGEYREAFSELPNGIKVKYMLMTSDSDSTSPTSLNDNETTSIFRLPHWFMNFEEWELLLQASERTQKPVLRTALGLSSFFGASRNDNIIDSYREHIIASCILSILRSNDSPPDKGDKIIVMLDNMPFSQEDIKNLKEKTGVGYGKMDKLEELIIEINKLILDDFTMPTYSHDEFEFDELEAFLELALLYEEAHSNKQIRDYCAQMLTRCKSIKNREEFNFLKTNPGSLKEEKNNLDKFTEDLLGLNRDKDNLYKSSQIIIFDMNEASDEAVEVASAVMARLLFSYLRKAEPRNGLPVHLILEEAHRYVSQKPSHHAINASQIFERIAKEGRKYGIFLQVASQRPSELSRTVLSQCSNFIIHRIQNPDDLSHIRQMTPFISESVIKRLPSLPKQHALIFGNAVNIPTTFKVRDVNPRPKSDDAEIKDLWFHKDKEPTKLKIPSKN